MSRDHKRGAVVRLDSKVKVEDLLLIAEKFIEHAKSISFASEVLKQIIANKECPTNLKARLEKIIK